MLFSARSRVRAVLIPDDDRLATILKKRTLSDEKLDEIKVKANILASFAKKEEPVEETDNIERSADEL